MTVIAVAGRRIDVPGTYPARFPLENVVRVQATVCRALHDMHATELTSSAANGADLIAAECALQRSLRLHIVLPFGKDEFKRRSVEDRPGDWTALFDRVIAAAKANGTLTILAGSPEDDSSYIVANHVILNTAAREERTAQALIIWDGYSRGDSDTTASFADEARHRGMQVHDVLTVP